MSEIDKACGDIRTKLIDYVDEDLSHDERLSVELHVAKCYSCREEVEELARLLELCGAVLRHPNPRDRFEQLKEQLVSEEPQYEPVPPEWGRRRRKRWHKLAVAAAIIIVLAAAPFLVKGVVRLLAPVEDPAALTGDGSSLGRWRRLLRKSPSSKQERITEETTHEGNSALESR
jgi:anti-sigma factor RsiW